MKTSTIHLIWRMAVCWLLFTTLMSPGFTPPARAALLSQEPIPTGGNGIAAVGDHLVTNFSLNPSTPNVLSNNTDVIVSFSYVTTQAGGVRIWARPFTNGAALAELCGWRLAPLSHWLRRRHKLFHHLVRNSRGGSDPRSNVGC